MDSLVLGLCFLIKSEKILCGKAHLSLFFIHLYTHLMASFGSGMMRSMCWLTTIDKRSTSQKPILVFLLSGLIKRNLLHIQMIGYV